MTLALVEHLNLTEDTTAAVTRPFLDYLQQKSTKAEPTFSRTLCFYTEKDGGQFLKRLVYIFVGMAATLTAPQTPLVAVFNGKQTV